MFQHGTLAPRIGQMRGPGGVRLQRQGRLVLRVQLQAPGNRLGRFGFKV